jgi:hypothetical protein
MLGSSLLLLLFTVPISFYLPLKNNDNNPHAFDLLRNE